MEKKKKNSRDKPTLPFHFRDEQTGVQRGEVSAVHNPSTIAFFWLYPVPLKAGIPWTSVHKDKCSAQVMAERKGEDDS